MLGNFASSSSVGQDLPSSIEFRRSPSLSFRHKPRVSGMERYVEEGEVSGAINEPTKKALQPLPRSVLRREKSTSAFAHWRRRRGGDRIDSGPFFTRPFPFLLPSLPCLL